MAAASFIVLIALPATVATAQTIDFDVPVTFAGGDLDGLVGTGIPNAHFVRVTNAAESVEVGLKALERFVGDMPNAGSRYFAPLGESSPGLSTWNYVVVGNLGPRTIAGTQIDLEVDFDPAFGVADFVLVDATTAAVDAGFGGLSVFGDSQNLGFGFWSSLGAPPFDPFAPGEYEVRLTVTEPSTGTVLARVAIVVEVGPREERLARTAPVAGGWGVAALGLMLLLVAASTLRGTAPKRSGAS